MSGNYPDGCTPEIFEQAMEGLAEREEEAAEEAAANAAFDRAAPEGLEGDPGGTYGDLPESERRLDDRWDYESDVLEPEEEET